VKADELLAVFTEAVHAQDSRILYRSGINVSLSSLPSWSEYQAVQRELFGRPHIIRYVKRVLMSARYRRSWERFLELQTALRREFVAAVSEWLRASGWQYSYEAKAWVRG
jgi:hypothetical protein